jgi:peroxiredoxin
VVDVWRKVKPKGHADRVEDILSAGG